MKSPTSVKEVQCLIGRIASLCRFLVASAWKALPLFALLKKEGIFKWTPECEVAFMEFEEYLSSLPIFCKPEAGQPLYLYPSVSSAVVTSALSWEDARQ